jgi:hypothetical protein
MTQQASFLGPAFFVRRREPASKPAPRPKHNLFLGKPAYLWEGETAPSHHNKGARSIKFGFAEWQISSPVLRPFKETAKVFTSLELLTGELESVCHGDSRCSEIEVNARSVIAAGRDGVACRAQSKHSLS